MTDRETLFDRCPEGRALDLMRMRQAKADPRNDNRPSWAWCLAIAALVLMLLKLARAI